MKCQKPECVDSREQEPHSIDSRPARNQPVLPSKALGRDAINAAIEAIRPTAVLPVQLDSIDLYCMGCNDTGAPARQVWDVMCPACSQHACHTNAEILGRHLESCLAKYLKTELPKNPEILAAGFPIKMSPILVHHSDWTKCRNPRPARVCGSSLQEECDCARVD
jgi:hypothetical protein